MRRLVNIRPARGGKVFLGAAPLALVAIGYVVASAARQAENPADKLLPPVEAMWSAWLRMSL